MSASGAGAGRRAPLLVRDGEAGALPLSAFSIPRHYEPYLSHVLIPHGLVLDRVDRLAADIRADLPDATPHLLVVLKGGSDFATDLSRALRRSHAANAAQHVPFTMDYVRVKSYEGTGSTGTVTITGIEMSSIRGRDVILVEDIIDTGTTMAALVPHLREFGPRSVRVAALLEKRTTRSSGFLGEYVGFSIPDDFVVGYNMDYNESFRDMAHVCVINAAGIDHFRAGPTASAAPAGAAAAAAAPAAP